MERWRKAPFKIYIQDIFRAKQSENNKYVYEMFGIKFKNVLLHGVVTAVYNTSERFTNFELNDPTGTVQVYYNFTKANKHVNAECMKDIVQSFAKVSRFPDKDVKTMSFMLERIEKRNSNLNLKKGYDCNVTSIEKDIIWMEEMRDIYDRCYLR
ncbi:uncharacterized protein LOC123703801 isoform X2 [Colias croceus]|uniref:uncharacterized protein LOC123703801 isoform X2 n=1 Tax=Colias crocea TaxID=72248 RepID=UPI001E27D98E|nr:uncharacterized protein LOC123703801 isoform X2 [Colias croceus]